MNNGGGEKMVGRIVSMLMTFGIIVCLVTAFPVGKVSASEAVYNIQDVTVNVDDSTKKVTIQGSISNGGSDVTAIITNPEGELDFLNQETSEQDGKFSLIYVPNTWDGEYEVKIGGENVNTPYEGEFVIGDDTPGGGNNNPGDGNNNPGNGNNNPGNGNNNPGDGNNNPGNGNNNPGNGDKTPGNGNNGNGKNLPNTATNQYNYLLAGLVLLIVGGTTTLFIVRRKNI